MSNFINELIENVKRCDFHDETGTLDMIESLGENAKLMLEIGILKDKLAELKFKPFTLSAFIFNDGEITVRLGEEHCIVREKAFDYTSPTWQQDVLDKVKELINDQTEST